MLAARDAALNKLQRKAMSSNENASELFVISDLHIGGKSPTQAGERGFRINTHLDLLARFVGEIGERAARSGLRTELVINGDFVDFLAEESPPDAKRRSFIDNGAHAAATFDAIRERDAALFAALRELLSKGVALTVLLGNHDIELSLPPVRARLVAALGAEEATRLKFIYDGEAYVAGDVLMEHGNRYDAWNVVDHDRLRRFRSESSRRLETSDDARFYPPAGSEMVELVMNPIKEEYPFIDLLKPETEAALPLLLTLKPEMVGWAQAIEARRLRRKSEVHAPKSPARPAQPGDIAGALRQTPADDPLAAALARNLPAATHSELLQLLQEAEQPRVERTNVAGSVASSALGLVKLRMRRSLESRLKILLDALRALQDDRSFDRSTESAREYLDAAQALEARGFSVVVFGHTHLAKEQRLAKGGVYLNTGTWADLLRVPHEIVCGDDDSALEHLRTFANAIEQRRFEPYLVFYPTFAHICLQQGRTQSAHIHEYQPGTLGSL
jgi:UDP-2,3-diacylglucosamine pyrophosphatase LpxH